MAAVFAPSASQLTDAISQLHTYRFIMYNVQYFMYFVYLDQSLLIHFFKLPLFFAAIWTKKDEYKYRLHALLTWMIVVGPSSF